MIYVSQYKKVYHVEASDREEEEIRKRNRRAIYLAEKKEKEREQELERRGYCRDCHYLLSTAGKCPKCGTIWNFHHRK